MAAPIPREAPVTNAQRASGTTPPIDHAAAPDKARAERAQQYARTRTQAAILDRGGESDRDHRGGRVADRLDALDHAIRRQSEPLAEGFGDPRVGLVVDEQ